MLTIRVFRYKLSHEYRKNPTKPFAWENNDAHNSLDIFRVLEDGRVIFSGPAQTIANMEGLADDTGKDYGARYIDSLAPGPFQLRAFVEPRDFYGRIHGICNARTLGGEEIGGDCTTPSSSLRTLVHDWQKHRSSGPAGRDTRVAWSAACLVLPDKDIDSLGVLFDGHGIQPGDLIDGELIEEGES
jgi:hypothetical protein